MDVKSSPPAICIDAIKETNDSGTLTLKATVKCRGKMKTWNRNKSSGSMITGILADSTGTIDFVCWTEGSLKFDTVLKEGETYTFTNIKSVAAKQNYSKSNHQFQIVLDKMSEVEDMKSKPFIHPLTICPIAELNQKANYEKVNIAAKVISIPPMETLPSTGTEIVKIRIQDSTGIIQLSLMGHAIKQCNFSVNDILLLENIELRIYGMLRVLQGSTGSRTVNPKDRDYSIYISKDNSSSIDLSPDKRIPINKNIYTLNDTDGRQTLQAVLLETNLHDSIYDKCPRSMCRSRVIKLDNGLYRCNKCEADYLLASKGLRLIVNILKDGHLKKDIVLFNELAEQFIEKSSYQVSNMNDIEIKTHEHLLMTRGYRFIVGPTKSKNEYLCETFAIIEKQNPTTNINKFSNPNEDKIGSSLEINHQSNTDMKKTKKINESEPKLHVHIHVPKSDENDNYKIHQVTNEEPMDLSTEVPCLTDLGTFELRSISPHVMGMTTPEKVDDIPLDLTKTTTYKQPPKKRFKFSKKLFPDMP